MDLRSFLSVGYSSLRPHSEEMPRSRRHNLHLILHVCHGYAFLCPFGSEGQSATVFLFEMQPGQFFPFGTISSKTI
jgi:hypothetical protein